jgi:hypothetical protein
MSGDVIEIMDSVTIERCTRSNGVNRIYELCLIYPDYMGFDNDIFHYKDESTMNKDYITVIQKIREVLE